MRLIVDHRDFPFGRETRLGRVVDLVVLLLLALLLGTALWRMFGQPAPATVATTPDGPVTRQLVLTIQADGRWIMNGRLVPPEALTEELERALQDRAVRVLFVTAAPSRPYGEVMDAMERARALGVTVGLLPPR